MDLAELLYIATPQHHVQMKVWALTQHLCLLCGKPAPCEDPKMCRLWCDDCTAEHKRKAEELQ